MFFAFLKSKTGSSLIIALLLIATAIGLKLLQNNDRGDIQDQIGLIAQTSVKQGLLNGELSWEENLKILSNPEEAISSTSASIATAPQEITATDRFSRELFTLYAQAKREGKELDERTLNEIAEKALSNDYSAPTPLITVDKLRVAINPSRAAEKAYGNAVGQVFSAPPIKGDHELVILERFLNGSSQEGDNLMLAGILNRYNTALASLEKIPVPQDAAAIHLNLVNGFVYLTTAIEGMITIEADPISSMKKIQGYEDGIDLVSAGAISLKSYFASKGIAFSSDEYGYRFMR